MCLKSILGCFLCLVNFAVLLVGAVVIAAGAILQWGGDFLLKYLSPALSAAVTGTAASGQTNTSQVIQEVINLMGQYYKFLGSAGMIIFIFGCVIGGIGVVGCCGAWCRLKILLVVYIACNVVILVIFTILVIIFFANRSNLQTWGAQSLQQAITSDYQGLDVDSGVSRLFDTLQARVNCCGVTNYTDFYSATKWNRTYVYNGQNRTMLTPISCCVMNGNGFVPVDGSCPYTLNPAINNFQKPCYPLLWQVVDKYNSYVNYALLSVMGILLVIIILSVWLVKMAAADDLTPL